MAALTAAVGVTTLDEARDVAFQDLHNDLGSGSLTMMADDADVAAIDFDDVVDVKVEGTTVGRWIVERKQRTRITDPESDTGYVFSGRTVLAELERTVVRPPRAPRSVTSPIFTGLLAPKPYSFDRHLGPMDPSFDISGWSAAVEVAPATGALSPVGWNDSSAQWIGGDFDYMHVAKEFTTTGAFAVTLRVACTDWAEIWCDGVLLGRIDPAVDEGPSTKTRKVIFEVNDGTHYLYAKVQRFTSDDCLFLCTGFARGTTTNVVRTDDTWKVLADTAAGYTPHQAIALLLAESQADDEADGWTLTSTTTTDTGGVTWEQLPDDFALRAGDTLLDVLRQMADAYIDFGVVPSDGARELSLWQAPGVGSGVGRGSASGVTFAEATNIIELTHDVSVAELRNRVFIAWGDGIIRGQIDGSVTSNGPRAVWLNIAQVADGPSALDVALATIEPMSSAESAVTVVVEPIGTNDVPGVDCLIADEVTAPNIGGTPTTYRMVGCSWQQSGDIVIFTPELSSARDIAEQRWQRWLSRTNHGTINGRSRSASASSPSIVDSLQVVEAITETFSTDGAYAPEVDDESAPKAADRALRLVRLVSNCTDAGVSASTFEMLKNGVTTGDDVDLADSQTSGDAYFAAGVEYEVADTMAVKVTAAGGHSGVTVVAHFVEPGG